MEILGIGPGEFVLILILLLVVVGPERLPDLARQAGRLLVRGRNWLQSSPDAAMVMRARQEIEQELANLKTSLLEVQSVRDEVLGAAKQIGAEVSSLTNAAKAELDEIGTIAPPKLAAPADGAAPLAEIDPAPLDDLGADAALPGASPEIDLASPAEIVENPLAELEANLAAMHGAPAAPANGVEPAELARPALRQPRQPLPGAEPAQLAGPAVFESIDLRLQAIMTDLFALQQQLKQRGVLADDWQPPSWDMQLPAEPPVPEPEAAAPAESAPAAELEASEPAEPPAAELEASEPAENTPAPELEASEASEPAEPPENTPAPAESTLPDEAEATALAEPAEGTPAAAAPAAPPDPAAPVETEEAPNV